MEVTHIKVHNYTKKKHYAQYPCFSTVHYAGLRFGLPGAKLPPPKSSTI